MQIHISLSGHAVTLAPQLDEFSKSISHLNALRADLAALLDRPDIFPHDEFAAEFEPLLQAIQDKANACIMDFIEKI